MNGRRMAKIVLSMDGVVLQEMALTKERITIGRRPHNDLVIDNSTVSAEHAVIVTMLQDAFIEDLNSTNGTRVNGQRISKHFLKNDDVIELAKYKIRFVCDDECEGNNTFLDIVSKRRENDRFSSIHATDAYKVYGDGNTVALTTSAHHINAIIRILNGPDIGTEIELIKPLTSIGLPSGHFAVVTRRGATYSLTHVEGSTYPVVNGKSIGPNAYQLKFGDMVQLANIEMEFSHK
jgi:pSer/pThr/pTyr-binding forkhead associated (FHA) protein